MVFVDNDGNKIKGSDTGMDEFRELLEKALPSFPRRLRRILREWLMVHRLGFGSRRAKNSFKIFFGWPPGLSFMQGATTHHWSATWAIPASIFRLIRTASGTWRRIFLYDGLRAHNDEDGIPIAARQHISHFAPLSLYAPTHVGKTVGMQWGNSLLVNAEMNLLIGQYGQPTQWVMMPLCPNKVRTVFSDWLGITQEGVAAMAYSNFDYRNFLK